LSGSFNALALNYYRSPEFRSLKSSTQSVRRGVIERFRREHGDNPVKLLGRAHIKAIIGAKAETPEAANNLLKVLRLMLGFAVEIDMIPHNPAINIKRFKNRGEGFHTWTEEEIAQFEAVHSVGTKPGLALALLLYTAQRRGDVVRMDGNT
jgi:integrase